MARFVREIMNRELVGTRIGEPPHLTRDTIVALGITAMPVLDDERRPIGMVSLGDLLHAGDVAASMRPPRAITEHATVEQAAHAMAEGNVHQLVVVDDAGRAIGMLSCIDVLRALVGMPARHPQTFPHFDRVAGVEWSDDVPLDRDRLIAAPSAPGVLVLVRGGLGRRETPVWVEATDDVRGRLEALVRTPQAQAPELARILAADALRFRVAEMNDRVRRDDVAERIRRAIAIG